MLLAAEAWGLPPWAIDPRPTPVWIWFQRWRFLTRERKLRENRKDGDPPPPQPDDWDDWE